MATARLQKELKLLDRSPLENIRAAPNPNDILEWHYVHFGHKGSPHEGGVFHGKLIFPKEYPFKPPSVLMLTPSGRFDPGKRICLSMSDFHPESWNPMWSVSSILTGLESFFYETTRTAGSCESSSAQKVAYARASMAVNVKNVMFRKLFDDIIEDWRARGGLYEDAALAAAATAPPPTPASLSWNWRHLLLLLFVLSLAFFSVPSVVDDERRDTNRHFASCVPRVSPRIDPRARVRKPQRARARLSAKALRRNRARAGVIARMLARARARASAPSADTRTITALECALASAQKRAVMAETKIVDLERALGEVTMASKKAEARARVAGERATRAAAPTLESEAHRARCDALERANARLREGLKATSERVEELEANARIGDASKSAATPTEGSRDEERYQREIARLRGELTRQATVIADAYRDELMKLQTKVAESEGRCRTLEERMKSGAITTKEFAAKTKRVEEKRRMFGSPYAYASYTGKVNIDDKREAESETPVRTPLTPRDENVFSRLATPKRLSTPRGTASPSRFR